MNGPHLNVVIGMAVPWPVFLILLVGNSHIHIRNHMIRVKVMLDEDVG